MKNRRESERERNIPYTRADPYTYQIQKILMAAFITPSPFKSIVTMDCGVFLFSFSVVEQFVCTEKMDLQKSAAVVFSLLLNIGFSVLFWLSLRMHEVRE